MIRRACERGECQCSSGHGTPVPCTGTLPTSVTDSPLEGSDESVTLFPEPGPDELSVSRSDVTLLSDDEEDTGPFPLHVTETRNYTAERSQSLPSLLDLPQSVSARNGGDAENETTEKHTSFTVDVNLADRDAGPIEQNCVNAKVLDQDFSPSDINMPTLISINNVQGYSAALPPPPAYSDLVFDCNWMTSTSEKGPDSTFPQDLVPRDCSTQSTCFSTNNVQSYSAATAAPPSAQQLAFDFYHLAPHLRLPLSIIESDTIQQLAARLDLESTCNWRKLAESMDFSEDEIIHRPTEAVIAEWSRRKLHFIGDFIYLLIEKMPEMISAVVTFILNDVKRHNSNVRDTQRHAFLNPEAAIFGCTHEDAQPAINFAPSTYVPYIGERNGVAYQEVISEPSFDAFLLCDMADEDFIINKLMPELEEKGKLKLCLPERDIPSSRLAIMANAKYMLNRSRKFMVILTDELLNNPEHTWYLGMAANRDAESRQQRLIPVIYKKLHITNVFSHLHCFDLTKAKSESSFWKKLIKVLTSEHVERRRLGTRGILSRIGFR